MPKFPIDIHMQSLIIFQSKNKYLNTANINDEKHK